jgi:predicted DNA-binding transcriptional regulator AlpA
MIAPERMISVMSRGQELSSADSQPESLLTAREVAGILRVRPKRVYELGIPTIRISPRSLRWRHSAVQQWLAEREGVA